MTHDERPRCAWPLGSELMISYHDEEWGVPEHDDRKLFEKLILDGAQAGLSWKTILDKREGYRRAFEGFDLEEEAVDGGHADGFAGPDRGGPVGAGPPVRLADRLAGPLDQQRRVRRVPCFDVQSRERWYVVRGGEAAPCSFRCSFRPGQPGQEQ